MLRLVPEDVSFNEVKIVETTVVLGRSELTGITDPNVSRVHAEILIGSEGEVKIKALGMNAPKLIKRSISGEEIVVYMDKGDIDDIRVGDSIVLLQNGKYKYTLRDSDIGPPPSPIQRTNSLPEPQPYDEEIHAPEVKAPEIKPDEPTAKKHKPVTDDIRPICKYGAGCYRHNKEHFREYRHPHVDTLPAELEMTEECSDDEPHETVHPRDLPECPYGSKCYRKSELHNKQYSHPKANADPPKPKPMAVDTAPSHTSTATGVVSSGGPPRPKNELADGDILTSVGSGQYKIKNAGGIYYCTCVAWRYQNKAVDERCCKHLREFLGDEYMDWKLGQASAPAATGGGGGSSTGGHSNTAAYSGSDLDSLPTIKVTAPSVLLANKWEEKVDPTGWWMSEKLDGVRAWWDGSRFISRLGNSFTAPAYFTKGLPKDVCLDGELFGGRKKFQFTVGVVKSSAKSDMWKLLTYQIFDCPSISKGFEDRLQYLETHFGEKSGSEFARVVEHTKCTGRSHLMAELRKIETQGGEGLMLRKPLSNYVGSRSDTLLKVKSSHDYEAKVVAHEPGKGKYVGQTGSLMCMLPNGKKFSVGSGMNDKDRAKPPPIGSIITFRFQELTDGGIPRFPRYIGMRADAKWPPDSPWPP